MPLVQTGAPFFSNAAGMSIQQVPSPVTTAGDVHVPISTSAASSGVTIAGVDSAAMKSGTLGTPSSHSLNTAAQTMLPQTIMAPFQLPSGSGQTQLQTQLALSQMLAPIQSVQPSVVLELNATTTKDGIGKRDEEVHLFLLTMPIGIHKEKIFPYVINCTNYINTE